MIGMGVILREKTAESGVGVELGYICLQKHHVVMPPNDKRLQEIQKYITALRWLKIICIFIGLNEHPVERLLLDETQLGALVTNLL